MGIPKGILIGVSGKAGAGKTTFAQMLSAQYRRETGRDVRVAGIADPIKLIFARLFRADIELHDAIYLVDQLKHGGTLRYDHPWGGDSKVSVRSALQHLGTEAGREVLGENIWTDLFVDSLDLDAITIVHDVRVDAEAQMIQIHNGVMIKINAYSRDKQTFLPNRETEHVTEGELRINYPGGPQGDVVINDGDLRDLEASAKQVCGAHPVQNAAMIGSA